MNLREYNFAVRSSQFAVRLSSSLKNLLLRFRDKSRRIFHFTLTRINRLRLKNKNFSVIASDCTGSVVIHDFGLRFNSPTVNLYFKPQEFVKFCSNLRYYISQTLREYIEADMNYPVGTLGCGEDLVHIYFMHYSNFEEARKKWEERCARINWENLFIILSYGERQSMNLLKEFDALPHKHKAVLTYKELDGINSALKISKGTKEDSPFILGYPSKFAIRRVIDRWDYVSFFNS